MKPLFTLQDSPFTALITQSKLILACGMGIALSVSACQPVTSPSSDSTLSPATTEDVAQNENNPTATQNSNVQNTEVSEGINADKTDHSVSQNDNDKVTFVSVPLDYQLPDAVAKVCKDKAQMENMAQMDADAIDYTDVIPCPLIDIKLAKIEPKWVEDVINRSITNDDNPRHIKFKQTLDEFANSQVDDGIPLAYSLEITPRYLGMYQGSKHHVAQFAIDRYQYLGGAHGMPTSEYVLFDMTLQSQIELTDVLVDYHDTLYELMEAQFDEYLKTLDMGTPEQIAEYKQMWEFDLAENFYFDKTGLVMIYQPYEIGSYAQGFIELTVPYDQLKGVIKPEYLPKD